jgi:hypothetical protein
MNKLLPYRILLIVALVFVGCGEDDFEYAKKVEFVAIAANDTHCPNELALIRADSGSIFVNPNNFKDKWIITYMDSLFGEEYCDMRTKCWLPLNMANRTFTDSINAFPLKIQNQKMCKIRYCGYKNFITILFNTNHQVLFEGEYLQMDDLTKRVPLYYAYSDSVLNVKPSKIIIEIRWDMNVNLDTLANLFINVMDGYILAADQYALQRFNGKICNLNQKQLDSCKIEFPFSLQFPTYLPPPELPEKLK